MSTPLDRPPDPQAAPPGRQCGRCREWFPPDPTLHGVALAEWWACAPCRESLLGTKRARTGGKTEYPTSTGDAP